MDSRIYTHIKRQLASLLLLSLLVQACSYTEKITDAKTAFDRYQFALAATLYTKEYSKADNPVEKGRIAFQIAESYQRQDLVEKAAEWYQKSYETRYKNAAYRYAQALMQLERYQEAIPVLNEAGLEEGSSYTYQADIQSCKAAIQWQKEVAKSKYEVKPVAGNSAVAEFVSAYASNGDLLIAKEMPLGQKDVPYGWTGRGYYELWRLTQAGELQPIDQNESFNTPFHETNLCFNSDYTEAFFNRCGTADKSDRDFCAIFYSKLENGVWTKPVEINLGPKNRNYLHPHLNFGDKALFFSMNDPDGFGGYDIYLCFKLNEGGWTEPRSLGGFVNTEKDEVFPFAVGDSLFFASDGHPGMGGLDIQVAVKKDAIWRNTTNLKAPINSGSDDYGIIWQREADGTLKGHMSSSRLNGQGRDDIYALTPRPKPPVVDTPVVVQEPKWQIMLNGLSQAKQFSVADDPSSGIVGYAPLQDVDIVIEFADSVYRTKSSSTGLFSMELTENQDYKITASKAGYFTTSVRVNTRSLVKDPAVPLIIINTVVNLEQIFVDREIVLENIYYDFDKWDIRSDAIPTLTKLVNVLKENPSIKIELASHTDCQGADAYNQVLSQKRAESVVNYLIERGGIAKERLSAKGYGETLPVETCSCRQCTDEQNQKNRRTTFKVVQ